MPGSLPYYSNQVTGDLTTGKTATGSANTYPAGTSGSSGAAGAIDNNEATFWGTDTSSTTASWQVDLGANYVVETLRFKPQRGSWGGVQSFTLKASTDNVSFTTIITGTGADNTNWQQWSTGSSTPYRYWRLELGPSYFGGSYHHSIYELELLGPTGANNITLQPPAAVSLAAPPQYADCYFLWRDDSGTAVIGVDLTVELSRDGGANWTAATLSNLAAFDGTYSVIRARADVSAQPAGTALTCRIKTLNAKAQRVAAPALYAE